jgi:hypothetical protein
VSKLWEVRTPRVWGSQHEGFYLTEEEARAKAAALTTHLGGDSYNQVGDTFYATCADD